MNERCPACGIVFEREPGYFTGAMYVSYILALPLLATLSGMVYLVIPRWSFEAILAIAFALFLFFVPWLFRASRVIWIHFDNVFDPRR